MKYGLNSRFGGSHTKWMEACCKVKCCFIVWYERSLARARSFVTWLLDTVENVRTHLSHIHFIVSLCIGYKCMCVCVCNAQEKTLLWRASHPRESQAERKKAARAISRHLFRPTCMIAVAIKATIKASMRWKCARFNCRFLRTSAISILLLLLWLWLWVLCVCVCGEIISKHVLWHIQFTQPHTHREFVISEFEHQCTTKPFSYRFPSCNQINHQRIRPFRRRKRDKRRMAGG